MVRMDGEYEDMVVKGGDVKAVGGIDKGWWEMEDGRRGGDSSTELHCTTVGIGGGDRLWFRSAAGKRPSGLGQTQPVALFEPSQ